MPVGVLDSCGLAFAVDLVLSDGLDFGADLDLAMIYASQDLCLDWDLRYSTVYSDCCPARGNNMVRLPGGDLIKLVVLVDALIGFFTNEGRTDCISAPSGLVPVRMHDKPDNRGTTRNPHWVTGMDRVQTRTAYNPAQIVSTSLLNWYVR